MTSGMANATTRLSTVTNVSVNTGRAAPAHLAGRGRAKGNAAQRLAMAILVAPAPLASRARASGRRALPAQDFPRDVDLFGALFAQLPIGSAGGEIGMPALAQALDDFFDRRLAGVWVCTQGATSLLARARNLCVRARRGGRVLDRFRRHGRGRPRARQRRTQPRSRRPAIEADASEFAGSG